MAAGTVTRSNGTKGSRRPEDGSAYVVADAAVGALEGRNLLAETPCVA
jgi:hypothetical protein